MLRKTLKRSSTVKKQDFWIEQESSVAKDIFIVFCVLGVIVLTFFLYRSLVSPDFKASLPSGHIVIDSLGQPLDDSQPVSPEFKAILIRIGTICLSISLLTFFSFFLILRWPKNSAGHWKRGSQG